MSQSSDKEQSPRGPLNCPKGYGLCWTCETWCDGFGPKCSCGYPARGCAKTQTDCLMIQHTRNRTSAGDPA